MIPALDPDARLHLIGIGGAGMSALARILLERGHTVTGSDRKDGAACAALRALGAEVRIGHDAANLGDADVVAASTAIGADNPELAAARGRGLPLLRRAELLAALMAGRRSLLVAGTHGKTTTTAMVTVCLLEAGLDPSYAIGGLLHDTASGARHGGGDVFVAEADESDRSFTVFTPDAAIVTNVELDHHDHYADEAAVDAAFAEFLARRTSGGLLIACADDPGAMRVAAAALPPVRTYGEAAGARVRITDVALGAETSTFRLVAGDDDLGAFSLVLPGRHNVANAAAAVTAARWAGADVESCRRALASFKGAQRRFHRLGRAGGVAVVDDYAHHPTELDATLLAARQTGPAGRVVAVFQPHRYSRTAALGDALGVALGAADVVVVTDVYGSGEAPLPGVDGGLVADAARRAGTAEVHHLPDGGRLVDAVVDLVEPGDLVLTLGAGDITELGPRLLERLGGGDGGG